MPNPLFKNALSALQKAALDEFRATALGQTVSAMRRARNSGSRDELSRLQDQMRQLASRGNLQQQIQGTHAYRALAEVERYAKRGLGATIMDKVFEALGPVGDLMQALLRPRGRRVGDLQQELETAARMLEQFGYGVQRPGQTSSIPVQGQPTTQQHVADTMQAMLPSGPQKFDVNTARRELESLGFRVEPPGAGQSQPPHIAPAGTSQATVTRHPTRDGFVRINLDGRSVQVSESDPLLTGKMIAVSSSNVHSIGFIWNNRQPHNGTLKVRFKHHGGGAKGGATYHYYDVHPQMFVAFQKAASKGKWVWDHLRIRGTVSGHQKRYQLAGLSSDGYVPRKAVRLGDEEWYLPRSVTGQNGQNYKSNLKAQMVRKVNRGRPGNGRASTGRVR